MYAVYVNGINFWEERGTPGIEKHVELPLHTATHRRQWIADGVVSPSSSTGWPQPTSRRLIPLAAALLIEQRTITVTVDEKNQEVALRWDSEFQVGPNAGKVTIQWPEL